MGADGHLKKPFDSQDLLSQVETLIVSIQAALNPSLAAPASPVDAPEADTDVFEIDAGPARGR